MTAARTGAAQKALELEMIPQSLFVLFCFVFPKGKIRRAQTPIQEGYLIFFHKSEW